MIRLTLLLILINCHAFAQVDSYQFSDMVRSEIEDNTKDNPDQDDVAYYFQEGAWKLSFIGKYQPTLELSDVRQQTPAPISMEDSLYFIGLKSLPAKDYIIEKAKSEQIIILNEAHHIPLHRVFAASLLEDLYDLGYTYFGLESYSHTDSLLNTRKYPLIETGYYIREPQFGNLLRAALELGFEVFPYEADLKYFGKEREIQQAKNIQRILEQDPKAKIFIYAGYSHIREDSLFNSWGKAMAGRLKEFTGIDPFTINQEEMTEKSLKKLENPFYRLSKSDEAVIYADSEGNAFAGSVGSKKFDVSVFHPSTKYVNGRPDWVFSLDRTPEFIHHKVNISCPCLILAYKAEEDFHQAVPVDVIELENNDEKKALALKKGNYNIIIKDIGGKQQTLSIKK